MSRLSPLRLRQMSSGHLSRLSGAAWGAFAVCAVGAAAEAIPMTAASVPLWRALAATAPAAALLGALVALLGGALFLALNALLLSRDEKPRLIFSRLEILLTACFVAPLVAGCGRLLNELLSGEGAKTLAFGFAAAGSTAVAAFAISLLGRGLWRRPSLATRLDDHAGLVVAMAVALAVGICVATVQLEDEVAEALSLSSYWTPFAAIPLSAVSCLYLRPRNRARFAVWIPAALLVVFAAIGFFLPQSPAVRTAIARKAPWTQLVDDWVFRFSAPTKSAVSPDATVSCGGALSLPGTLGRAPADAPHIVFLTIDAMRCDHTTLCGYKRDTTPNLARAARRGVLFTHAVTPSSTTRQSMGPMFSGIPRSALPMPAQKKAWGAAIGPKQPTLAEYLKAAGYRTVLVNTAPWVFRKELHVTKGFEVAEDLSSLGKKTLKKRGLAQVQIERIAEHLKGASASGPLFVQAHFMDAHEPYRVPSGSTSWGKKRVDKYDAALTFVDAQIGGLLDRLDTVSSRPVYVVITADHGEGFGDHGTKHHGHSVYQEEVRVPLLILGTPLGARKTDAPVSLLDLAPTIAQLAGLNPMEGALGQSLVPFLRGASPVPDNVVSELVLDHKNKTVDLAAYYRGEYKLVVNRRTSGKELFHLPSDPRDKSDLSRRHPALVDEMEAALERLLASCGE